MGCKYWIYLQNNPDLKPSPFLNRIDRVGKEMIRFILEAHNLRIETGRWCGLKREERLCNDCRIMDDEYHAIYECREIYRADINGLPEQLKDLWDFDGVNVLFKRFIGKNVFPDFLTFLKLSVQNLFFSKIEFWTFLNVFFTRTHFLTFLKLSVQNLFFSKIGN